MVFFWSFLKEGRCKRFKSIWLDKRLVHERNNVFPRRTEIQNRRKTDEQKDLKWCNDISCIFYDLMDQKCPIMPDCIPQRQMGAIRILILIHMYIVMPSLCLKAWIPKDKLRS